MAKTVVQIVVEQVDGDAPCTNRIAEWLAETFAARGYEAKWRPVGANAIAVERQFVSSCPEPDGLTEDLSVEVLVGVTQWTAPAGRVLVGPATGERDT